MDFHASTSSFFDSSSSSGGGGGGGGAGGSPSAHFARKSFLNHVFANSDESKAEFLNAIQYSLMGIAPIVLLNKSIQRFSPEADVDKSSLEILAEIFIQVIIMFCGIIVTHRVITYFPTYSGYKYENFELTNVILAFLVIILSIQTKIGIKVNIVFDRLVDLWNGGGGSGGGARKKTAGRQVRTLPNGVSVHSPSQADYLDNSAFPSAPIASVKQNPGGYEMMRGAGAGGGGGGSGGGGDAYSTPVIVSANSVLGSSFGSSFY